jgi:ferrous iron transport protein A
MARSEVQIPLELLAAGDWADVAEVHGEPAWIGRMAELGIRSGCRLQVVRTGSPCLLKVGETRLSLRSDATSRIFVHPIAPTG